MSDARGPNSGDRLPDWQDRHRPRDATSAGEAVVSGSGANRVATSAGRGTLTDAEVAVRLGVSRFTVRSWRLKGQGPRFLKMGRAVRYRPEDVDDYVQRVLVSPE
jgi:excisionase family DNA binding protein